MIDYHLHTRLCKHASGTVNEYIESAIQKGIKEIAFTDHIPMPDQFDIQHRMTFKEMDRYQKWIESARQLYPDMIIRFGIEADYYEGYESFVESFLQKYDFDLVIMSVHFIRHWPTGNWVFDYTFHDKSIEEVYQDYMRVATCGVETGLFDIVGHADMIKKAGHSLLEKIPDQIADFMAKVKLAGMAVEINTSGYRKESAESYPGFDWLVELARLGIPICVGSDAHKPDQVGLQFENVYSRLKEHPSLQFARFASRKMTVTQISHKTVYPEGS